MGCLFFYMEFFRWMVWNLKQLFGTAMKTSPFNTMTSYPRIKRRKVSVKLWPPRPTSSNIVGRNNVGRCWTGGPNGSNIIQHDIRQYRNLPKSLSCARAWAQQCWTWWPSGPIQHESKENVGQCWTECLTGFKLHLTSSNISHPTRWPNEPNMLRRTMLEGDVGLLWPRLKMLTCPSSVKLEVKPCTDGKFFG